MPNALHLTSGRIAVLVTLCAVATGVVLTGGGMFSPGKLNAQPKRAAQLGGVRSHSDLSGNCSACHVPPWGRDTMADRCMVCHTDVRAQLDARGPLHGRFADGAQCRACHSEHKGARAALTDLTAFDHNCAAFALTGKHATVDCASCHKTGAFKGTPATCLGCHAEPKSHFGQFGTDCAKCHTTANWRAASFPTTAGGAGGAAFDHSRTAFPLTGHHAAVDCKKCHADNKFKGTPTACVACHAEPKSHFGKFGTDCKSCHGTVTWKLASVPPGALGSTFDHSKTAFPLTGKHTAVACALCHKDGQFKGTQTACVACHAEPKVHAGSKFGTDCKKCHTTSTWTGGTLGDFKHTFPIGHGRKNRAASACSVCHAKADAYATYTCYGCHEHNPAKVARQHKNVANLDNCVKCHKGGRQRGAADFGRDEFLASCPAEACDGAPGATSRCPHDADPWPTFYPSAHGEYRLADPLRALVALPRPAHDLAARGPHLPRERALAVATAFDRFDPFARFLEPRQRTAGAEVLAVPKSSVRAATPKSD